MIGYINEISDGILKDAKELKIVWNGSIIWITNYIKILEFGKEKISLKVKNNILNIEGINIDILMLEKNEITLSGKFNSVYLEKQFKSE